MNNTIHVLDSMPGTRKTSGAIEYINNNPSKRILYICEYNSEIDRVCSATHCVQPTAAYNETLERYHSKRDNIKQLLVKGESIASSHSLFINFDEEILGVIRKLNYEIILDEVVDPICGLKSKYNDSDHETLSDSGLILTDPDTGRIDWNWRIKKDSAYHELQLMCETGQLYKAGNRNKFLHILPVELFSSASKVTVMTYNFEGSHLYQYFRINNFEIVPETDIVVMDDSKLRRHVKDSIIIHRHRGTDKTRTQNQYGYYTDGYTLSYSSYDKSIKSIKENAKFRKFIGNSINKITRDIIRKADDELDFSRLMYTMPMDYSGIEKDDGFVGGLPRKISKYRYDSQKTIKASSISPLKCFVPLNCRGTNAYKDKAILIHCYNQFANPAIKSYYDTFTDIDIDQEKLALNNLIQWVFRSRIRNYVPNEKIYVYMMSERMERILQQWLESL